MPRARVTDWMLTSSLDLPAMSPTFRKRRDSAVGWPVFGEAEPRSVGLSVTHWSDRGKGASRRVSRRAEETGVWTRKSPKTAIVQLSPESCFQRNRLTCNALQRNSPLAECPDGPGRTIGNIRIDNELRRIQGQKKCANPDKTDTKKARRGEKKRRSDVAT